MKAATLTGIRKMEIQEIPMPRLQGAEDVLVKVGAVGICGSDLHYYLRGGMSDSSVDYPWIAGHEAAGTVVEVGENVTRVKPGDRIAVEPAMPCGKCDQCLAGRPNTCRDIMFMSCAGELQGSLCEYVVVPAENCFPVKDSTSFEEAALSEPLSICYYAVKQSGLGPEDAVAILGAGPIGLGVLLCVLEAGCRRIYVTEKVKARLDAARTAGATWTGNPEEEDVVSVIKEKEPLELDVVFECCGDQKALDQAFDLLKPGGKLMIIGVPEQDRISFDSGAFRRKELTVSFVRRQIHCVQSALDLIEGGKVDVGFMLTHRFGIEETARAFGLMADYKDGVIKAMVVM